MVEINWLSNVVISWSQTYAKNSVKASKSKKIDCLPIWYQKVRLKLKHGSPNLNLKLQSLHDYCQWGLLMANFKRFLLIWKTGEPLSETVQVRGDSGAEFRKGSFKLQPPEEIDVKKNFSVEKIPVFTLIRTDTTLDLSQ